MRTRLILIPLGAALLLIAALLVRPSLRRAEPGGPFQAPLPRESAVAAPAVAVPTRVGAPPEQANAAPSGPLAPRVARMAELLGLTEPQRERYASALLDASRRIAERQARVDPSSDESVDDYFAACIQIQAELDEEVLRILTPEQTVIYGELPDSVRSLGVPAPGDKSHP